MGRRRTKSAAAAGNSLESRGRSVYERNLFAEPGEHRSRHFPQVHVGCAPLRLFIRSEVLLLAARQIQRSSGDDGN